MPLKNATPGSKSGFFFTSQEPNCKQGLRWFKEDSCRASARPGAVLGTSAGAATSSLPGDINRASPARRECSIFTFPKIAAPGKERARPGTRTLSVIGWEGTNPGFPAIQAGMRCESQSLHSQWKREYAGYYRFQLDFMDSSSP